MSAKVWGGSETNIDIAFQKIKELKPFAAISSSQDELYQMFDTGICDIAIEFGSLSRKYGETRNPNLVIASPQEGQAAALNVACITVGHSQPEACRGMDQSAFERALHARLCARDLLFADRRQCTISRLTSSPNW